MDTLRIRSEKMSTTTTNYGLYKYQDTDLADLKAINSSMDTIDAQMKTNSNNIATKIGKDTTGTTTSVTNIWTGTQAEYDAIGTKVASVLYFIH